MRSNLVAKSRQSIFELTRAKGINQIRIRRIQLALLHSLSVFAATPLYSAERLFNFGPISARRRAGITGVWLRGGLVLPSHFSLCWLLYLSLPSSFTSLRLDSIGGYALAFNCLYSIVPVGVRPATARSCHLPWFLACTRVCLVARALSPPGVVVSLPRLYAWTRLCLVACALSLPGVVNSPGFSLVFDCAWWRALCHRQELSTCLGSTCLCSIVPGGVRPAPSRCCQVAVTSRLHSIVPGGVRSATARSCQLASSFSLVLDCAWRRAPLHRQELSTCLDFTHVLDCAWRRAPCHRQELTTCSHVVLRLATQVSHIWVPFGHGPPSGLSAP